MGVEMKSSEIVVRVLLWWRGLGGPWRLWKGSTVRFWCGARFVRGGLAAEWVTRSVLLGGGSGWKGS